MKKKILVGTFLGTMALASGTALAGEMAGSEIESVKVNCSVQSTGQRLDTIEVKVKDPEVLNGIQASAFTMEGKSYGWGYEKEDGFRSHDVHDFTATISGATVEDDTLILNISDFNEKYYYVDSYTVTCSTNEALTFTKDQVTEVATPVADDFEQLTKSFDGQVDLVYNLYTPDETDEPMPLVLAFHGIRRPGKHKSQPRRYRMGRTGTAGEISFLRTGTGAQ